MPLYGCLLMSAHQSCPYLCVSFPFPLADPEGGAASAHAPTPNGGCTRIGGRSPPERIGAPQWEILDPPLILLVLIDALIDS